MNRTLGALAVLTGLALAGWAPAILALLAGHSLPAPVESDSSAMMVWAGVAFARVCGAVLVSLGAVLYVSNLAVPRPGSTTAALFVSSLVGTAVVTSQQIAIWSNRSGWLLVMLFACVCISTGLQLGRAARLHGEGTA